MNKYSNLFICLFVLLFCSSCGDLLNQKPESAITNESFWTNQDDATGVLTHSYVQLRSMSCGELFTLGESRSDVITRAVTGDIYERYYKNTLSRNYRVPTGLHSIRLSMRRICLLNIYLVSMRLRPQKITC